MLFVLLIVCANLLVSYLLNLTNTNYLMMTYYFTSFPSKEAAVDVPSRPHVGSRSRRMEDTAHTPTSATWDSIDLGDAVAGELLVGCAASWPGATPGRVASWVGATPSRAASCLGSRRWAYNTPEPCQAHRPRGRVSHWFPLQPCYGGRRWRWVCACCGYKSTVIHVQNLNLNRKLSEFCRLAYRHLF